MTLSNLKALENISQTLSEQELIDCNGFDMGCDGGWPADAFQYVKDYGLGTNEVYEFVAYSGECANDRINRFVKINDFCECEFE
jgi:hypothetical protein